MSERPEDLVRQWRDHAKRLRENGYPGGRAEAPGWEGAAHELAAALARQPKAERCPYIVAGADGTMHCKLAQQPKSELGEPKSDPQAVEAVARALCENKGMDADGPISCCRPGPRWEAFKEEASAFLKRPEVLAAMLSTYRRTLLTPDFVAETLGAILDKYAPYLGDLMDADDLTIRDKLILKAVPALTGGRG